MQPIQLRVHQHQVFNTYCLLILQELIDIAAWLSLTNVLLEFFKDLSALLCLVRHLLQLTSDLILCLLCPLTQFMQAHVADLYLTFSIWSL